MERDKPIHPHLKRRAGSPELWDVVGNKKPRREDLPDDNMEISSVSLERKCPPQEIDGSANKWLLDFRWQERNETPFMKFKPLLDS